MILNKSHYYIYLQMSPWPLVSRFFAMNFFFSLYLLFFYNRLIVLLSSMIGLIICSYQWWRDFRFEYSLGGFNSNSLDFSMKYSMVLFISSEVFFFLSFFWSYFHFLFSDSIDLGWI